MRYWLPGHYGMINRVGYRVREYSSLHPIRFCAHACLCLFSLFTPVQAELYKWTDERGKSHYSDQPPAAGREARVVPIDSIRAPDTASAQRLIPLMKPYDRAARPLLVLDAQYAWRHSMLQGKPRKIGTYHVGKACTSRGAMTIPNAMIDHGGLFPKEVEIGTHIAQVIRELKYPAERVSADSLATRIIRSGGLVLQAEIIDMDFNTCASSLARKYRLTPVSELESHRFNRHRVRLTMGWTLSGSTSEAALFVGESAGRYAGWSENATASEAIKRAVDDAALQLFGNAEFVALLMRDTEKGAEKGRNANPAQVSPYSERDHGSPTLGLPYAADQGIALRNVFVLKARLTEAYSDLSQLKMLSTQFFYQRGDWPGSLSDLGLSSQDFQHNKAIDTVSLHYDGAITAELSDLFGKRRFVKVSPRDTALGLRWQCSSNLARAYLPPNCESK